MMKNVLDLNIAVVRHIERTMVRKGIPSYIQNDEDRAEVALAMALYVQYEGIPSEGNPFARDIVLSHLVKGAWRAWAEVFADERKQARHNVEWDADFFQNGGYIGKPEAEYNRIEVADFVEGLGEEAAFIVDEKVQGYSLREIAARHKMTFYAIQSRYSVAKALVTEEFYRED